MISTVGIRPPVRRDASLHVAAELSREAAPVAQLLQTPSPPGLNLVHHFEQADRHGDDGTSEHSPGEPPMRLPISNCPRGRPFCSVMDCPNPGGTGRPIYCSCSVLHRFSWAAGRLGWCSPSPWSWDRLPTRSVATIAPRSMAALLVLQSQSLPVAASRLPAGSCPHTFRRNAAQPHRAPLATDRRALACRLSVRAGRRHGRSRAVPPDKPACQGVGVRVARLYRQRVVRNLSPLRPSPAGGHLQRCCNGAARGAAPHVYGAHSRAAIRPGGTHRGGPATPPRFDSVVVAQPLDPGSHRSFDDYRPRRNLCGRPRRYL